MLVVNEEKFLKDYEEIKAKQSVEIKEIEEEARKLAVARGYSEERIEQFVNYVKAFGDDGLSKEEAQKLSFYEEYLEEVEEEEKEETESVDDEEDVEETNASVETEDVLNNEQPIYNPIEITV